MQLIVRTIWLGIACMVSVANGAPPVTAVAFAPDGKQAVLGSQAGIEIHSWPYLKVAGNLPTELDHVHDLAFSPDGRMLLAAGGAPAEKGAVEMWTWPKRELIRRVAEHDDLIYRAVWSPDGKQFATAGADGVCQVFATDTGRRLVRYEGHSRPVLAICYLPDGKSVISAGVDQTLRLWDSSTGRHIRTLDNHVGPVNDVAMRPGGAPDAPPVVASVSEDGTVRLWQPTIGRLMRFARLASVPRVVAWSPDGTRLITGGNDGRVRTLDPDSVQVTGEHAALSGRIHALAVAANGVDLLVAGENDTVKRLENRTNRNVSP
jgi:WD40 repeat protein